MSDDATPTPSRSIWTRPIDLPPTLMRVVRILRFGLKTLGIILTAFLVISLAFEWYHAWTFRPGARLMLSERVYLRVPAHFSGMAYEGEGFDVLKSYSLHPARADYSGNLVAVDALNSARPLGFRDPARMAAYARKRGKEVRGPVHFGYLGFEVTATVEPTTCKARAEGAHTLQALVNVRGQLVYITGDSATLGVRDDAEPQAMAEAAIDLLRLTAD